MTDEPARDENEIAPPTSVVPVSRWLAYRPREGWRRVRGSANAIVQLVLAPTAAYVVAHLAIGHASPLLAATVAISSLGLSRDARPRRVLETTGGMLIGILLAEIIRFAVGSGWWQLGLVLALTLVVARFAMPGPQFAVAATVQASIAMILPATGAPFARLIDGLVGGLFALLVCLLLPRNPTGVVRGDGTALFAAFDAAAARVAQGLRSGDGRYADRGLEKARDASALVEAWRTSIESARAVSALSPFLRSRRVELARFARIQTNMDLAARNLRVIARRAAYLCGDGARREVAADTLAALQQGADQLAQSLTDIAHEPIARDVLGAIARRLDPAAMLPDSSQSDQALVAALRPLAVDLLVASGVPRADARAMLPRG